MNATSPPGWLTSPQVSGVSVQEETVETCMGTDTLYAVVVRLEGGETRFEGTYFTREEAQQQAEQLWQQNQRL